MFSTIAGDVGGYMGLLLGASAVTVFEVLDLLIYNMILKCLTGLNPEKTHGTIYKSNENGKTIPHENGALDQAYENGYAIREDTYDEKAKDKYVAFSYETRLQ